MAIAILCALVGVPVVLLILLRSNAALAFLFLCSGIVLQSRLNQDFWSKLGSGTSEFTHSNTLSMALIAVPLLLSTLLLAKSVKRSSQLLHIVPAICSGLLLTYAIIPLLPSGKLASQIVDSTVWKQSHGYQGFVVLVGLIISLLIVIAGKQKHKGDKKHH
jgi:hypothetical protein